MRYVVYHAHNRHILAWTASENMARILASEYHNYTYTRLTFRERLRVWLGL